MIFESIDTFMAHNIINFVIHIRRLYCVCVQHSNMDHKSNIKCVYVYALITIMRNYDTSCLLQI